VNGECLELFLYTCTFTSALIWELRHSWTQHFTNQEIQKMLIAFTYIAYF